METYYPVKSQMVWCRTGINPVVYSFGMWDGTKVVNILATCRKRPGTKLWVWNAFHAQPGGVSILSGVEDEFDGARHAAEQALRENAPGGR